MEQRIKVNFKTFILYIIITFTLNCCNTIKLNLIDFQKLNFNEIRKLYDYNDSLLINYLVSVEIPDTISGYDYSLYSEYFYIYYPSKGKSFNNVENNLQSLKIKSLIYIIKLVDSTKYSNIEIQILNDSLELLSDYTISEVSNNYLKNKRKNIYASSLFSKHIYNPDSLIFYKNQNYQAISNKINIWYKAFLELGLEKIKEQNILPISESNIIENKNPKKSLKEEYINKFVK